MRIKFYLAEEVRLEAHGKFTILGLYPDDVINFNYDDIAQATSGTEKLPPGMDKLSFLIHVSKLTGFHKFSAEIFDPNDEQYKPKIPLGELDMKEGASHAIFLEVRPFVAFKFGTYKLFFYVDDEKIPFNFDVILQKAS